jgi:hypothetical protein
MYCGPGFVIDDEEVVKADVEVVDDKDEVDDPVTVLVGAGVPGLLPQAVAHASITVRRTSRERLSGGTSAVCRTRRSSYLGGP